MPTTAVPKWEACKENVLPIKRGRSVKGLSVSLTASLAAASQIEVQEMEHEKNLEEAINNRVESSQLLDVFALYFKWLRDSYPTQSDKSLKLLERCTCSLKDDLAMKNDIRYVKMWIEYADLVRLPGKYTIYNHSYNE